MNQCSYVQQNNSADKLFLNKTFWRIGYEMQWIADIVSIWATSEYLLAQYEHH